MGKYYAYTLPGSCDGRITFNGAVWQSQLPPSVPVAPFAVWMRLESATQARFISPKGSVGFDLAGTGPAPGCRG